MPRGRAEHNRESEGQAGDPGHNMPDMSGPAHVIRIGLSTAIAALSLAMSTPAQAASASEWCWSMDGGNVKGAFTASGSATSGGVAPSGTYTLTDASVISSTYPEIEVGSISNGTYAFGSQPDYRFNWSGSVVTQFSRASGTHTNGFSIDNGFGGTGAYLGFNIGWQRGATSVYGVTLFTSSVTPTLSPAPTGGCPRPDPDASATGLSEEPLASSILTFSTMSGTTCTTGMTSAAHGSWLSLPPADDCRRTDSGKSTSTLMGWSTTPDFPVEIARNQVAMGWGTYDGPINGQRMVFIPAGGSTLVSGDNTLHPIWGATA